MLWQKNLLCYKYNGLPLYNKKKSFKIKLNEFFYLQQQKYPCICICQFFIEKMT